MWGEGWNLLSKYQRECAIAHEIVLDIKAQDEEISGYERAKN
jgi:hypothetical protein